MPRDLPSGKAWESGSAAGESGVNPPHSKDALHQYNGTQLVLEKTDDE